MKKIIALFVIVVAAASFGAVSWSVDVNGSDWTGADILVDDVVTVTFTDDSALNGGFTNFLTNVSLGTYVDGSYAMPTKIFETTGAPVVNGTGFDLTVNATVGFGVPAGDRFSFQFVADQMGVATISGLGTYNGVNGVSTPDVDINVVPEPITMALMGLGGLFIRRRRA